MHRFKGIFRRKMAIILFDGKFFLTNSSVKASSDNDATGFAGGDIGAREDDVFLVLVDSSWVGNRFVVLDHGNGFTGQDGLVNPQSGGHDGDDPDVSGDFVTDYKEKMK